ncbi:MAG TPA: twin-arginine translocase TatA/TatE family subunit [Novosphingobium sp.]|jgi:sec-independent protein translocase protein TatA|nr:twin-arginine translocase TatA/TatE family subunit [Novosphingobium sp.]
MGFGSIGHWIILLVVVLILFGRGRISEIMGDFGKGIKSFKQGLNDEDQARNVTPPAAQVPPAQIPPSAPPAAAPAEPAATQTTDTVQH